MLKGFKSMKKSESNNYKPETLATWLIAGFIVISQLTLKSPEIQLIALGILIAIQYKTKSLSKFTLGFISVAYIVIFLLWFVGT